MSSEASAQPLYHLAREGQQYGPMSAAELFKMAALRHLRADDLVEAPGFFDWKPASDVPDSSSLILPMQEVNTATANQEPPEVGTATELLQGNQQASPGLKIGLGIGSFVAAFLIVTIVFGSILSAAGVGAQLHTL